MTNYGIPFQFDMPMSVFEKADAPEGQQRRIGGIASVETRDKQNEVVLARGLDFSEFLSNGWFNDNHSKDTDAIVGYPDTHKMFKKGEILPDGRTAPANGHWVEGYLLEDYPRADRLWKLARSLAKTDRRLGLSIEGRVLQREKMRKGGSRVAAAKVRNVAVTNCPVNTGSRMEVLAKSLLAVERANPDVLKALAMGTATSINPPSGPQAGSGAGQVLTGQSLESDDSPPRRAEEDDEFETEEEKKKREARKSYDLAVIWAKARMPHATWAQAERFVRVTRIAKNGTMDHGRIR